MAELGADIGFLAGLGFAIVLLAGFLLVRNRGTAPKPKAQAHAVPSDYGMSRESGGRAAGDVSRDGEAQPSGAIAAAAGGALIVGYAASHGHSASARDDADTADGGSGEGGGDGGDGGD